jgi:para-nitrobenzyl esterase
LHWIVRKPVLRSLLLGLALFCLASPTAAFAQPVRARLDAGLVEGVRVAGVSRFLGIPYAAPPLGQLRWRAPAPTRHWRGVRSALEFSAGCMQAPRGAWGPYTHEFVDQAKAPSEDCLYLNVWTPASERGAAPPILLWIHGGAFIGGASSVPIYNGEALARRGVIIVSLNYRLGTFGYFATGESPGADNFGVLDVIAALRWLRANAAAFGGDASRITIAGQSAGAAMVNILLTAPGADGLFAGAISESMPLGGVPMRSSAEAAATRDRFLRAFDVETVDALRAAPADQVLAATELISPGPMAPIIDGVTLAGDPLELLRGGGRSSARVMAGVTANESAFLGGRLAYHATFAARYGASAGRFLDLYPADNDIEARAMAGASNRDRLVMGLRQWVGAATDGSVFLYVFTQAPPGPRAAEFGAFHSAEIPYVFGTLSAAPERGYTEEDALVSARMMTYWSNFVKRGDPNGEGLPGWSPATQGSPAAMELGGRWGLVSGPDAAKAEFFRAYFAQGGRAWLF